jgi:hydrogenase maturation factor HypE
MKPVISITAAVLAAATTMAHANVSVNVSSSKISQEAKDSVKALLQKNELSAMVNPHVADLAKTMKIDSQPLNLDVSTMLAAWVADSTLQNIYDPTLANCYSNCYTNCHGSRSWR